MNLRRYWFLVAFSSLALFFIITTPIPTHADTLNLAAGFVPCEGGGAGAESPCTACHLIELANNIIKWLIGTLTVVFAILVMVAGFKLVTSGGNASAKEDAKKMMTNALIGFILVLGAWILVDTGLRALLKGGEGQVNGALWWQSISCDEWQQVEPTTTVLEQPDGTLVVTKPNGTKSTVNPGKLSQCSASNSACSVSALQAAGLNSTQANIMSCIAVTESSGIASTPPYNQSHPGSNSTACGTFQITRTTWNGNASGGCSNFYGSCQNAQCNINVMVKLVKRNGYSDWTCPNCNSKASACVYKYSNQ